MVTHKGALKTADVERRVAIGVRFVVPPGGQGSRLDGMRRWLASTVGEGNCRVWPAQRDARDQDTLSLFDDPSIAPEIVIRFRLEPRRTGGSTWPDSYR